MKMGLILDLLARICWWILFNADAFLSNTKKMRKPLEIPYIAFKQFKSDFNKNQVYRDLKERERKTQEKLKTTLGLIPLKSKRQVNVAGSH